MLNDTECCGVKEISGLLDSSLASLKEIAYDFFDNYENCAFMTFTDVYTKKQCRGENLKRYIKKNNLGTVIETEIKKNPNSGNRIKLYVWSVDRNKFQEWYKLHPQTEDRW